MAQRGASAVRRIELNRKAFDAITLAVADGAFELAQAVVSEAKAPDAPPYGRGLPLRHGVIAFVGKKRVGAVARDAAGTVSTGGAPETVRKPRAAKLSAHGITVVGGYGFTARFAEAGTVREPARPFLTPSLMAHLPGAEGFIRLACVRRKVVNARRAARGDVYRKATT